jgi:hypothetical protein
MTARCSTSLCESTDPFVWLEGDAGEAGSWVACGLCYARLQLLPAAPGGRFARMPEHDEVPPPAIPLFRPPRSKSYSSRRRAVSIPQTIPSTPSGARWI